MGSKKKKNSNYVTEKTEKAKKEREKAKRQKRLARIIALSSAIAISLAMVVVSIVFIVKSIKDDEAQSFTVTHHATIMIEGYGSLHVELYGEEAPVTVTNFVNLANSGYYNGTTFNQVVKNPQNRTQLFYIAGGDSSTDTDAILGEFEANGVENNISHKRGVISMSRTANYNSATSGFFIALDSDFADSFDGEYAAFGRITDGMDIIDDICDGAEPVDSNGNLIASKQPKIISISIHAAH